MKKIALVLAVVIAGITAQQVGACVAAGHGGTNPCEVGIPSDGFQHCFVGKVRTTPNIGGSYALDVQADIGPVFQPTLYNCGVYGAGTVSAWVMSHGATNFIQVGEVADCNFPTETKYFQGYYTGSGGIHVTLLWDAEIGYPHTFAIHRNAGTNTFQSTIDGVAYFPPVTVPSSYGHQSVLLEDTVKTTTNPCHKANFWTAAYATGVPGYAAPSWQETTPLAEPGMRFRDNNAAHGGSRDYFTISDWSS